MSSITLPKTTGPNPGTCRPPTSGKQTESSLSKEESETLRFNEAIIMRGLKEFYAVGSALTCIRDQKLHRGTHHTFADYAFARFGYARAHANRLMASAKVVQNLSPNGDILEKATEFSLRALTRLKHTEKQLAAWQCALEIAAGDNPTAEHVNQAVARLNPGLTKMQAIRKPVTNPHDAQQPQEAPPIPDAETGTLEATFQTAADVEAGKQVIGSAEISEVAPVPQAKDFLLADGSTVPFSDWMDGLLIPEERVRSQLQGIEDSNSGSKNPGDRKGTILVQKLTLAIGAAINRVFPVDFMIEMARALPNQVRKICNDAIEDSASRIENLIRSRKSDPRPRPLAPATSDVLN